MDIPARPTMRDLYQLLATVGQQLANQSDDLQALREELAQDRQHQNDNIEANRERIRRLETDVAQLKVQMETVKAWQLTHQFTCPYSGLSPLAAVRAQLQHLLARHFDLVELNSIIFDMGINGQELADGPLTARVQDLVLYCERRSMVNKLLEYCRRARPEVTWPLAYE